MKVLIAGSRGITDMTLLSKTLSEARARRGITPTEVLSGGAKGVDTLAVQWAEKKRIPYKVFEVTKEEWDTYGKAAGPMRNSKMIAEADAVVALWDGASPGTADTIRKARAKGLPLYFKLVT